MRIHSEAEQHLKKKDKKLGAVIENIGSCQLDHESRNKFDVLASSIVSQQLSAKAAKTIKGRILSHINESYILTPRAITTINLDDLRKAGLSRAKSKYIIELATNILNGSLDLEELHQHSDEDVIRLLVEQNGIGNWTAEMFLIFALGRKDILSTSDAGLLRSSQKLYNLEKRPTVEEFTSLAEKWRPHRSIACWYLWRYIDT